MSSTISDGTTTITPTAITGYQADQTADNVLHTIVGLAADAVTLRPAGLRSGTLTAVMPSITVANSLITLLAQAKPFTLASTEFTTIGMTFVLSGKLSLQLDSQSNAVWLVVFDFQEVGS